MIIVGCESKTPYLVLIAITGNSPTPPARGSSCLRSKEIRSVSAKEQPSPYLRISGKAKNSLDDRCLNTLIAITTYGTTPPKRGLFRLRREGSSNPHYYYAHQGNNNPLRIGLPLIPSREVLHGRVDYSSETSSER
ncbi:hypothetical protein AVEN_4353-1 [Araneus ventricosus]|uniref:Uncharacterized protein n=1 Tax=Araneus ventricosus TaxID=182803 RepID=A0A4Y2LF67_ARAVE|nr:hypothetical protein AVEN_4353-1 [Araneus ventricosus]